MTGGSVWHWGNIDGREIKKTQHKSKVLGISQLDTQEAVLIRSFSREESKDFANTDGNRF